MYNAYKPPAKGGGSGADKAICALCQSSVSPEDMATLECGMIPNAHKTTMHVICAEQYATSEANKFLRAERLAAICPRLAGGGASANMVSNTLLKALGLQDMLDATTASKNKASTVGGNGKMPAKYLNKAKEWANDKSIAKKLLIAACPHKTGCGLTIEEYMPPLQSDPRAAAAEQSSAAPRKARPLAAEIVFEEVDKGQCIGTKIDGSQCPRSSKERGGDLKAGLCRRCTDKAVEIAARATVAATQDDTKRASAVAVDTKKTAKVKTGGLNALLKSTAKPVETCQSCGSECFAKKGGVCPATGEKLCGTCIRPIIDAAAALAAEKKADDSAARAAARKEAHEMEARARAEAARQRESEEQEAREREAALEHAAAQRLAQVLNSLPTKQLVCGERVPSGLTTRGREAVLQHYGKFPQDEAVIKRMGIVNFAQANTTVLQWTPLVGDSFTDVAGVITAAGRPGVPPVTILAKAIADSVASTQPAMVTSKGSRVSYTQQLVIPSAKYPRYNFMGRIIGKGGENIKRLQTETGCFIKVEEPNIYIEAKTPEDLGNAIAQLQPILEAPSQYAEELEITFGDLDDVEISSNGGSGRGGGGGGGSLWGGADKSTARDARRIDPADGKVYTKLDFFSEYGGFEQWNTAEPAPAPALQSMPKLTLVLKPAALQPPPLPRVLAAADDGDDFELTIEADHAVVDALLAPGDDECAICLESLRAGRTCMLPCRHTFHVTCVEEVKQFNRQTHAVCPLCQQTSAKSPLAKAQKATAAAAVAPLALDEADESEGEGGGGDGWQVAKPTKEMRQAEAIRKREDTARAAEDARRKAADEARAAENARAAREARAYEAARAADEARAARAARAAEAQRAAEAARFADAQRADEARAARALEQRRAAEASRAAEARAAADLRLAADAKAAATRAAADAQAARLKAASVAAAAAAAEASPALLEASPAPEATPEVAKALVDAGPTIELLREGGVSDATLLQLVAAGLTTLAQVMAAHDDGLKALDIKKGPRVRILKILSPLTLEFEDEGVKALLERFHLGQYRARCADEQIDVEALCFFAEEPDSALAKDLGIKAEDFAAFREAIRNAGN